MEASVSTALMMVLQVLLNVVLRCGFKASCLLALSEAKCGQTQYLHSNGSCVECRVCGPGEQLSEDCGYGDGGEEDHCEPCPEGHFSDEPGLAPCRQCTQCLLLNRKERSACFPINNAQCSNCLPGFYELRSLTGAVDLSCMPCYSLTGKVRKECLPLQQRQTSKAVTLDTGHVSISLIGSATAASSFLVVLFLWACLLVIERFRRVPKYRPKDLNSEADTEFTQNILPCNNTEPAEIPAVPNSETPPTKDGPHGCLNILSHEGERTPTSIVINVTANIKSSHHHGDEDSHWEQQRGLCDTSEEMQQKLMEICTITQGQSLEKLDYDTVQDLSLLLDSGGRGSGVRRLGHSLGVPPEVLSNLHGFQDLFGYLRTSTYTLLPELAQAASLLPRPDMVARIHRSLMPNHTETSMP